MIVFDESHAMQNAAGGKTERGEEVPSQQGRAGLRLQHALPDARVVYVSATGATTVHNLAYAQRLGLWGGADFPFATRAEFVEAIEAGGVAAMEVLARDLKSLGLYTARSLSYEGVEYELVEHALTPEQRRIYDAYAGAFEVIHNNLDRGAGGDEHHRRRQLGTLNAQAKSAARSAFESAKQRFFNHLITAMKTPTLIKCIERDLEAGHAAVVQLVSTGEALMERRLADIPTEEWGDVLVDITPREIRSRLSRPFLPDAAVRGVHRQRRQPGLAPGAPRRPARAVPRGGGAARPADRAPGVAATRCRARSTRSCSTSAPTRSPRSPAGRGASSPRSMAPATGASPSRAGRGRPTSPRPRRSRTTRSASWCSATPAAPGAAITPTLGARNRRLRVHYLLEAGWKADTAIQGLGRTNRTNQAQPPLFRPIATDVKAEKRFLSTIARRLDTLGAITKGQRQTGGQGLFRPEDNLESVYARAALRQLYVLLYAARSRAARCSASRTRPASRSPTATARSRRSCRRSASSSTGCWR